MEEDAAIDAVAEHDGGPLLNDVRAYLGRFICYPSEHAAIAHTLWVAQAHLMPAWESTPRLAFLSAEPESGKTRCLEVTEPLVPPSHQHHELDGELLIPSNRQRRGTADNNNR